MGKGLLCICEGEQPGGRGEQARGWSAGKMLLRDLHC